MRPCTCDRCSPIVGAPYTSDQCRLCWLYRNDPAYRAYWDRATAIGPAVPARARAACRHLGEQTNVIECPDCHGKVRLKVFSCAAHVGCTLDRWVNGLACCKVCPDYQSALPTG